MIDEQDAIRRCQIGDRESFRPIVERYGSVLMGTIYLMVRDRAISEELVQETFVRAWNGIATFRLGRPLKPWLVRIAVNQALNANARRQTPVEPLSAANEGGAADPGFGQSDEQHEVRQALSRLSADHRRVVVLRYFADLSTREAADALGIREGTVKSRLARALEQLREILGS
ncbi:MAG: RNA polymerase sigma factor [Chloroflexota bacterium]|nr:RNA polymerase sigma factor [Chloroflexota bacterium]MDE2942154.1 RNA polymerase sigma factor [Chloroflexota bacterium]MDE3268014.1 RNA polymerase sigma factor [Chloroflexota bacterium]